MGFVLIVFSEHKESSVSKVTRLWAEKLFGRENFLFVTASRLALRPTELPV
jgi:hypothetical protein